jgi:hypothetical protein
MATSQRPTGISSASGSAAAEESAAVYKREAFTVERIESSATGNPALGVVWRARRASSGCGGLA